MKYQTFCWLLNVSASGVQIPQVPQKDTPSPGVVGVAQASSVLKGRVWELGPLWLLGHGLMEPEPETGPRFGRD